MKRLWLPSAIFVAAIAFTVGEIAYRYPQLPERVASHFNAGGQADGWTTKGQFAGMWVAVIAMLAFMFGMTLVIISIAPAGSFNLPNRDYWLAPERAAATRRMVVQRMLWFMAALMLFIAYLSHEAIAFNLNPGGQLTVWTPLGVFLAFTAVWCGEMYWTFRRTPHAKVE
jgi:uncharacterized membrane protein